MDELEFQKLINDSTVEEMNSILDRADKAYWSGQESFLTDVQYDIMAQKCGH